MLFRSLHEDIEIPTQIQTWEYLFSPELSPPNPYAPPSEPKGFTNTQTGERVTHDQTKQQSIYLSAALRQQYLLSPGDVVSICSSNSVNYPTAMFGLMHAGAIPALSAPAYTVSEMQHAFSTVGCKLIIASVSALGSVTAAAGKLGLGKNQILTLDGEIDGFKSIQTLIKYGKRLVENDARRDLIMPWNIGSGKSNTDVCAVLCFSSGTTGLPKAVMISHHNIVGQCLQLLPTTSDDHKTVLGLLPFYHITGVIKLITFPFKMHAEVIILPTFTMPGLLDAIVKYQIAEVQVVPPIIIRLVHDPIVLKYDLSCIKRFASGAAPSSREILDLLQTRFPGRGFKQGYGMTESSGCITTHPLGKHSFKYARTGGTLCANTLVKIVNGEGKTVGVDEKGEILFKGPQMVMGYYNNPKATAEAYDAEGYLRTGDEGSISSEGFITIHDRLKEMIKVKGIQVAPAELEDLLLGHPEVEDCAVIGIRDDYSGERPFAFVVLKAGMDDKTGIEERLMGYVRQKVVKTKWLVGIEFVDAVPKSASGKILRRALRDRFKSEAKTAGAKL